MEDLTKLPKWAQSKINVLEMRLREEKARNAIIDAGESNTLIWMWDSPDVSLPNNAHIRFRLADSEKAGLTEITVNVKDDVLRVSTGVDAIAVYPGAANTVEIGRRVR
jgi:hypothetical protein